LAIWYYIQGGDVYCQGRGEKKKGEALSRIVSLLEGGELAYFQFEEGGWLLVRGMEGWLGAFLSLRESPDEVRLKLLASLEKVEKEVKGRWQLL